MKGYQAVLWAVACALASGVQADTVWMQNGDKLSGSIVVLDEHKLILKTEYGGRVALDLNKVATFSADQPLLVKTLEHSHQVQRITQAGSGHVLLQDKDGEQRLAVGEIRQMLTPKVIDTDLLWQGNVDVSLNYKNAESDSENYALDLRTKARDDRWRHNADVQYRREFKDQVRTTDNWGAQYALDRFFSERWFWQGRLNYKRDHVEEISEQRVFGTGPGFQLWDNELGSFSVTSLLNRSDYQYDSGKDEHFYSLAVKWDYQRNLIGRSIQLFSNGEVGKPLGSVADYSLDTALGVRYKVTDWASLNMRAEKDIVSGAKGDLDETRYSIGFGVGW